MKAHAKPPLACRRIAPAVDRVADGEGRPAEAMRVARHVHDCTACRILLARGRRLAAMLDSSLEDHLPVGEEFVREVMANLPQGPPPRRRHAVRRRLKLAVLCGLLALGSRHLAAPDAMPRFPEGARWLPPTGLEGALADRLADGGAGLGGIVSLVLERCLAGLATSPGPPWMVWLVVAVAVGLAVVAACASAGLFVIRGLGLWPTTSSRSI